MVDTFIEIYPEDSQGARTPDGDSDRQKYNTLTDNADVRAIYHNVSQGDIPCTVYRVENADESLVTNFVSSSTLHNRFTDSEMAVRAIELHPGTPTNAEVDSLASRLQSAVSVDITTETPNNTLSIHAISDLPSDALGNTIPDWASSSNATPGAGHERTVDNGPERAISSVLKNDHPSVGSGNWICHHPEHDSPETVSLGNDCSLGHVDDPVENAYAQPHRDPFDISEVI